MPSKLNETVQAPEANSHGQVISRQGGSVMSRPPVIFGEDPTAYGDLMARVTMDVAPKDVIEELWIRDVVELAIEAQAYRRAKASLLSTAAAGLLVRHLREAKRSKTREALTDEEARVLTMQCLNGNKDAETTVLARLAEISKDWHSIMAEALNLKLYEVERIDRLIAATDARRGKAITLMERRRADFAARLRTALPVAKEDARAKWFPGDGTRHEF